MGMHTEQLSGRTQQRFFTPSEEENFTYPEAYDVDFNKRAELDCGPLSPRDVNLKIRDRYYHIEGLQGRIRATCPRCGKEHIVELHPIAPGSA